MQNSSLAPVTKLCEQHDLPSLPEPHGLGSNIMAKKPSQCAGLIHSSTGMHELHAQEQIWAAVYRQRKELTLTTSQNLCTTV